VITVFRRGILDFSVFLLIITLSWTNHGEISSILVFALLFVDLVELFLVLAVLLLLAFLFSLLLIILEFVPLVSLVSVVPLLILLLIEFLLFMEFDFERLEAKTGSLLADCWAGFLPTLDIDRVTGWLFANEVSILFSADVLESVSEFGSKEASGELLGEPVDIGEPGAGAAVDTGGGTSRRSRNGFLLLLGEENGLDLPMVANFCPAPKGLFVCVCVCVGVGEEEGGT